MSESLNGKEKEMEPVLYHPVGTIRSPFEDIEGAPIQPSGAKGVKGSVEMKEEYVAGLKDLDGFSHVILLYHFHLSEGYSLRVKPFLDDEHHGVFATRAPKRPNSIGLSIVKLIHITGNILYIEDVDVIDGTPLLDVKPYVPVFDMRETVRTGWLSQKARNAETFKADDRFK